MAEALPSTEDRLETAATALLAYCRENDWAGYDPYDALNSRLLKALPFLDSRIPRLVFTQVLKRSPINVRPLLLVPPTQNPKALALFMRALLLFTHDQLPERSTLIEGLIERLKILRAPSSYYCWGYSFPWQTRTVIVPTGSPNLVCTVFVAGALLDAYESGFPADCLNMAVSAAEYILNELYWTDDKSASGFGYPFPHVREQVHNANFLAAELLCRVYKHTGERKYLEPALRATRCSASKQSPDGSWRYGEDSTLGWIDNFHTGFNLLALRSISQAIGTAEFDLCIRKGFQFYRQHFFLPNGVVRYFHNRTYPIDVHCVAQSIITLVALRELDASSMPLAHSVFRWSMGHMWDERGYFYYRVLRTCTIRTPYMRWSQAWMLLALSMMVKEQGRSALAC